MLHSVYKCLEIHIFQVLVKRKELLLMRRLERFIFEIYVFQGALSNKFAGLAVVKELMIVEFYLLVVC